MRRMNRIETTIAFNMAKRVCNHCSEESTACQSNGVLAKQSAVADPPGLYEWITCSTSIATAATYLGPSKAISNGSRTREPSKSIKHVIKDVPGKLPLLRRRRPSGSLIRPTHRMLFIAAEVMKVCYRPVPGTGPLDGGSGYLAWVSE